MHGHRLDTTPEPFYSQLQVDHKFPDVFTNRSSFNPDGSEDLNPSLKENSAFVK